MIEDKKPQSYDQKQKSATISFVGDLLCYNEYISQSRKSDGINQDCTDYDFTYPLAEIKKEFQKADYVVGNLETPIHNRKNGMFYPPKNGFFAPQQFLEGFIDAGVDLFLTANNHCYDQGREGFISTIETLNEYGVNHIGTYLTPEAEENVFIKDINGIKIAFLNYTFGINNNVHGRSLSEIQNYQIHLMVPPQEQQHEAWWNLFPKYLQKSPKTVINKKTESTDVHNTNLIFNHTQQIEKITIDIDNAKKTGADIVVVLPHLGMECMNRPLPFARQLIDKVFRAGADIIISGHPHALQPMEFREIKNKDGSARKGFVIYSLGNFISHELAYCPHKKSSQSVILSINLEKQNSVVHIKSVNCVPILIEQDITTKHVQLILTNDAIKLAVQVGDNVRAEKLRSVQKKIHSVLTSNSNIIPENCWEFTVDMPLAVKRLSLWMSDIHYAILRLPKEMIIHIALHHSPKLMRRIIYRYIGQ